MLLPCCSLLMYVTPRDGLLGSTFDGITEFAVVIVRVFPELQALQVFILYFAELKDANPIRFAHQEDTQ